MKKELFLTVLFFTSMTIYSSPLTLLVTKLNNMAQTVCCKLFGNEQASPEVVAQVHKIREIYGIQNITAPVNWMDTKTPWRKKMLYLFGSPSAFTWFGTWIKKKSWETMTEAEKVYDLYHEVGLEYLNNPLKEIGITVGALLTLFFVCTKIIPHFIQSIAIRGLLGVGSFGLFALAVQTYYPLSELRADRIAVQKLVEAGQVKTVEKRIELLNDSLDCGLNYIGLWFPTVQQQLETITQELNKNKKQIS
jgi:hypothetical protein